MNGRVIAWLIFTDLDCDLKTRYWQQVSPCWWTDYKREIKVIGNVYDNLELVKGG